MRRSDVIFCVVGIAVVCFCLGGLVGTLTAPTPEPKNIERVIQVPEPCHDPNTRAGMIAKAKQAVKDLNRCTDVLGAWGYEVDVNTSHYDWEHRNQYGNSYWYQPVKLTIKEVK